MEAAEFLNLLREALNLVGAHYFGINYYNDELLDRADIPEDHPKRELLRKHLARHGERVFCYELYHQIRFLMGDSQIDLEENAILQAELKKDNIRLLMEFMPDEIQRLRKEYIPDFLLHSPSNFEHQEAVVEVKANPEITFREIFDDLKKLDEFITNYSYKIGLLLIVNAQLDYIHRIIHDHQRQISEGIRSPKRILIMVKTNLDTDIWEAFVADII